MSRNTREQSGSEQPVGGIRIVCKGDMMRDVGEIIPYERNAKIHGPEQLERLRASLREFGFVRPLLIDRDGNLLAGHGTLAAAVAEGMTAVPCNLAEGLSEAQRKAYILADNKLAELAEWNQALLTVELEALQDLGFDVCLTGFDLPDTVALDLGDDDGVDDAGAPDRSTTYHCPKCGFEFSAR